MKHVDVMIHQAETFEDYAACVELQKQVWEFRKIEDLTGHTPLMLANRHGGSLLMARDSSGIAIGFSFAMPAWRSDREPFWWSHMTAVQPAHRNHGIGLMLKLRQREEALARGIQRIEWTFDPLQSMNAYFNIRRLGVTISEYEENVYGRSTSPLHRGLPTDRLVAEWQLNSERVHLRIGSNNAAIPRDVDSIAHINTPDSGPNLELRESLLALEIPLDANQLKSTDIDRARQWQDRLRTACLHYFHIGYTITDFVLIGSPARQALYILERQVNYFARRTSAP